MIVTKVKCDYCDVIFNNYVDINVCEVEDTNDGTKYIVHACPSCFKYYILNRPKECEIKLLNRKTKKVKWILDNVNLT